MILIIGLMSVDFIGPSLPYIQTDLHASQTWIKNSVLLYMLVLGIGQLFYGYASDQYGRKSVVLVGLGVSLIGLVMGVFAENITLFYLSRILTAIGCAACPVIARAMITDISKDSVQLKKSFSIFSLTSQLSPGIAPVLGGLIQSLSSWHVSLGVLVLMNLTVFFILYRWMPETHHEIKPNNLGKNNFLNILKIYSDLFRHRYFFIMSLLSALIYVYTIGFYNMLPFVLHTHGVPPWLNGVINSAYAFSLMLGALALQKSLYRIDSKKLFSTLVYSYVIYGGLFLLIFMMGFKSIVIVLIWGCGMGFLCGIIAPLTLSLCMHGFSKNKGAASAVQSSIKMFFTGIGLVLFSLIHLDSLNQMAVIFGGVTVLILGFWLWIKKAV